MIALVRLPAPSGAGNGTAELTSLPEAPASRYTAFAVRCRDEGEVREALAWYRRVLESRPETPLGLVARATDCVRPVADLDRSLVFVMDPARLSGGALPASALETLREAGIEGRIMEEIVCDYGPQVLSQRQSIEALIARAAAGGTLQRAANDVGVHPNTLARWLKGVGLSPRRLRQQVRVRAFELRVEQGMERNTALDAGGWTDHEKRRQTLARLRDG
jgi:AraC-like DNA-binding protein